VLRDFSVVTHWSSIPQDKSQYQTLPQPNDELSELVLTLGSKRNPIFKRVWTSYKFFQFNKNKAHNMEGGERENKSDSLGSLFQILSLAKKIKPGSLMAQEVLHVLCRPSNHKKEKQRH